MGFYKNKSLWLFITKQHFTVFENRTKRSHFSTYKNIVEDCKNWKMISLTSSNPFLVDTLMIFMEDFFIEFQTL